MNALFLCLHRLGDFFQQVHLIEAWARTHKAKAHVVAFSDCQVIESLFPTIRFHFLPRQRWQDFLVRKDVPWTKVFSELDSSLQKLNDLRFREIYNLTTSSFAARLMDRLRAPVMRGVRFADNTLFYANPSAQSLAFGEVVSGVRVIDQIARSCDLSVPTDLEIERDEPGTKNVWIKTFTSDENKNLSAAATLELVRRLELSGYKYQLLAGPGEEEKLRKSYPLQKIASLSFQQMKEGASDISALISVDTSTLHWAPWINVPAVGLYVGSARADVYPVLQRNSLSLQISQDSVAWIDDVIHFISLRSLNAKDSAASRNRSLAENRSSL